MKIYSNKHADTYKKLEKLSLFSFLANLPNFFITLFSAFTSGTIVVWVDTMVSLQETLHCFIVWIVARKMYKESGDKYNFGMGRLEVFISFICDTIISLGMICVTAGSIFNIINPTKPSSTLLLYCVLKISNSIYDLVFYIKQIKICKAHPSKLNETEKTAYLNALINDVAIGVISLICYLFRDFEFVMYFSPIISIILVLYFMVGYVKHIISSIAELSDVSLPIKKQDEIYDIVMENREMIKRIVSVNCRKLNDKAHIEISLIMQESATYSEMEKYLDSVKHKIKEIEPDAEVLLVIGTTVE